MMIPAFEAATREMFSQVATSLESSTVPAPSSDALNAKIDALTTMVQALTAEVTHLRRAVGSGQQAPPSGPTAQQQQTGQMERMRSEIVAMIKLRNYEAAFTKALSATTAEMAVFACKSADLADVLGGTKPALSQPIILCLMQQLGTGLVSASDADLQITLAWLQEIALTLDPTDESIQRHIPSVLQQLVASINAKMQQGDPNLRRPLQMLLQVIRGMQR
jgi:outer membrane murein-binding lipoprotein Lpp